MKLKKLVLLIFAVTMLSSLSACDSKEKEDTNSKEISTETLSVEEENEETAEKETEEVTEREVEETEEEENFSKNAKPVDDTEYECDDFVFLVYDDNSVEITKYIGDETDISIPSELNNYPVSRIGESAFKNKGLKNIYIPDTCIKIKKSAFEDCTDMKSVYFCGDKTNIGECAFKNCSSLDDIYIPSECEKIEKSAFEDCTDMKSVYFCGDETNIGECAFKNCSSLDDIYIPSECKKIEDSAFEGCSNLKNVYFCGENVEIGVNAFANCPKLDELPEGAVNIYKSSDSNEDGKKENDKSESDEIRPEFKEVLDSYEAFFDEYCEFMKKYKDSPDDISLLGDYAEYMEQYSETMEKISELENEDMNDAELKYYLEVTNRIQEKMLDVAL